MFWLASHNVDFLTVSLPSQEMRQESRKINAPMMHCIASTCIAGNANWVQFSFVDSCTKVDEMPNLLHFLKI